MSGRLVHIKAKSRHAAIPVEEWREREGERKRNRETEEEGEGRQRGKRERWIDRERI